MEQTLGILVVVALSLGVSFFMSGMEAGVFALSRLRIRQLMRAGRTNARVLHSYLEHPEDFLWTILVGNTLANFVAVTALATALRVWLGQQPLFFLACFIAFAFLFYTFFDLLPKMLFRMFPNRLCLALVGPFRFVHLALSPLVAVLHHLSRGLLRWTGGRTFTGDLFGSREELRLVMQESAQALTSEERAMINRVLDLQNSTVGQITTPLMKVVMVSVETPLADGLQLCREQGFSRLPVWSVEDGRRHIVGILNLRTLLYQEDADLHRPAGQLVKPALYLNEGTRLEEALRRMQRSGQRLAIVLGRDQREAGIVSLQDILRSMFGEVSL